jgi:hypothetical protein
MPVTGTDNYPTFQPTQPIASSVYPFVGDFLGDHTTTIMTFGTERQIVSVTFIISLS